MDDLPPPDELPLFPNSKTSPYPFSATTLPLLYQSVTTHLSSSVPSQIHSEGRNSLPFSPSCPSINSFKRCSVSIVIALLQSGLFTIMTYGEHSRLLSHVRTGYMSQ
ncbi:hypothetical protein ATANTOWER_014562 [Ataeniobius toweri]|uniref:Uncharacterized protein n=1 Tax=Ataeniobius toweri TaxID=208326 RepID=A0ABU7BIA0_9TELE|nr:hypothetical protein [Ataeniobius toweri]